jgi:hypothetical protein
VQFGFTVDHVLRQPKKIFSNCTTLLKVSVHLVFTRMGHGVFLLLPFHIISTTPQKDQLAKEVE